MSTMRPVLAVIGGLLLFELLPEHIHQGCLHSTLAGLLFAFFLVFGISNNGLWLV